jgi:hypothetical protein
LFGNSGAIVGHSNSVSSYRRMNELPQFGSLNHVATAKGIPFMSSCLATEDVIGMVAYFKSRPKSPHAAVGLFGFQARSARSVEEC